MQALLWHDIMTRNERTEFRSQNLQRTLLQVTCCTLQDEKLCFVLCTMFYTLCSQDSITTLQFF